MFHGLSRWFCLPVATLFISGIVFVQNTVAENSAAQDGIAQANPLQMASEQFSACLMQAVDVERAKAEPSVDQVKAACRQEIDTLYGMLGDAVDHLPSLDQRLQEELSP